MKKKDVREVSKMATAICDNKHTVNNMFLYALDRSHNSIKSGDANIGFLHNAITDLHDKIDALTIENAQLNEKLISKKFIDGWPPSDK